MRDGSDTQYYYILCEILLRVERQFYKLISIRYYTTENGFNSVMSRNADYSIEHFYYDYIIYIKKQYHILKSNTLLYINKILDMDDFMNQFYQYLCD